MQTMLQHLQSALVHLANHQDIPEPLMLTLMRGIMEGRVSNTWTAALLAGLKIKGESVSEIFAAAKVMREFVLPVNVDKSFRLMDLVGTGGDGAATFNISTCSAFVASAAGAMVAKHCVYAVSSRSGAANSLEALGIRLDLSPENIAKCIELHGIAFILAPRHHKAMRYVAPVRLELGVRTLFNLLGPLTNPANATVQLTGVFSTSLLDSFAEVLQKLGCYRAMIVHGEGGMDEISICGKTFAAELTAQGAVKRYVIDPNDVGLSTHSIQSIKVNSPEQSAQIIKSVLRNEKGSARDVVLLNAGAALYLSELAEDIREGVHIATQTLENGKALDKLQQLAKQTQMMQPDLTETGS